MNEFIPLLLTFLLIISGIGLAVWGMFLSVSHKNKCGYVLKRRRTDKKS